MSRKKRIWQPDYHFHIVSRGNRREPLFVEQSDFDAFFHILYQLHEKIPFEITSYCLMTNHYHLQILSPEVPFSKIMFHINKGYANYFNTKYDLTGHVFETRYRENIIADPVGMLKVSTYIHLNPVKAFIVKDPEHYPWSSYSLYKNHPSDLPPFMNTQRLLDYFEGTTDERREKYLREIDLQMEELFDAQAGTDKAGACHASIIVE